jgi:histidinol phosphatase-like PHP family hydrolase
MLQDPAVDVWAHPFSYPRKREFDVDADTRAEFGRLAAENDVLVELNLSRPNEAVHDLTAAGARRIVGYDLHDVDAWE